MSKIDKEKMKEKKEKAKGLIGEFKAFIQRGNVIDLAVGVVIGSAFSAIITSLTDNFINPLIQVITGGKTDNIGGTFKINGVVFNYGAFISAIINFLIIAFVLFIVIKAVNKLNAIAKKKEEEAKEEEPPKKPDDVVLLEEIRDLLKKNK